MTNYQPCTQVDENPVGSHAVNSPESSDKPSTELNKTCSYPFKLQKLGITTLKDRRERGDMIEVGLQDD